VDRCEECGFEYDLDQASGAAASIQAGVAELAQAILSADNGDVRTRRRPQVWSPLEYACHVRDVLLVQRERVLLARRVERPSLAMMGRDERVEHDGYSEQDPADVARQMGDAALMFANDLRRITAAESQRTLIYNFPEPTERTLDWVAMHTLHEVRHHIEDVRAQLG
jgi:hypothetical protein